MNRQFPLACGLLLLFAAATFAAAPESLANGKIPDESLEKLAPKSGVIADDATFEKLWKAWRPGEVVPEVDFEKDLVIVGIVDGPNLVMLNPQLEEDGNVKYVVAGTRMAGPGFGYRMVKMSRDGVKTINGKPIVAGAVQGTIIIPKQVPSFDGQTLEIKLFEFDPLLADAPAKLVEGVTIDNFQHKAEEETETPFAIGAELETRKDRGYYITVFVLKDGKRTHIGEIDAQKGLNKVLQDEKRSNVKIVIRSVRS